MKAQSYHFNQRTFKWGCAIAGLSALWFLRNPVIDFLAWMSDHQAVVANIQQYGACGPIFLFILLVLQVFLAIIPGHTLMAAGGYIYGFIPSLMITLASTVLGSQLAFLFARRAGRPMVYRLASPVLIERWEKLAAHQGTLFYFFSFVLPTFPSDAMCYVAGLGKITPKRFFVANVSGRLICALFITLVGSYGSDLPLIFWGAVLAAMTTLYLAWRFYSKNHIHNGLRASELTV